MGCKHLIGLLRLRNVTYFVHALFYFLHAFFVLCIARVLIAVHWFLFDIASRRFVLCSSFFASFLDIARFRCNIAMISSTSTKRGFGESAMQKFIFNALEASKLLKLSGPLRDVASFLVEARNQHLKSQRVVVLTPLLLQRPRRCPFSQLKRVHVTIVVLS